MDKNTQSSFLNSACFCSHSQSADLDGFSKHPYENLPKCRVFFNNVQTVCNGLSMFRLLSADNNYHSACANDRNNS